MNKDTYISTVENLAQKIANRCGCANSWREELQNLNTPFGDQKASDRCICWSNPQKCGKCVICKRCGFRYDPEQQLSVHSSAGDYESLPEVYLASVLEIPWYTCNHTPYMYTLIENNRKCMNMTENEIYEGLIAIVEKYPRILAWIHFKTLYIAFIARLPKVIILLTEWMEKRDQWFTPTGVFNWLSREFPKNDYTYTIRCDTPHVAREGAHNTPTYLNKQDWTASTINLNHSVEAWVNKENISIELLQHLGRALACNGEQFATMCCGSMNEYTTLKSFIGCISHCITNTSKHDLYPTTNHFSRYNLIHSYDRIKKVIYHTIRSRCKFCVLDTHPEHNDYYCNCIPSIITETIPTNNYEYVIAHAVKVRRRKFRGIFWCASVLAGKIRHLHYRPGIGMYFKQAKSDWEYTTNNLK